ncbi:MAG: LysM peptidoglycan-binding domain-containing protein [Opitutus sp.]|nr:LysM peptidoglycan-binding domain-containing protein [Opitutus sp.]
MKILKIFGIVVGIHVFALVLIFANPGCSSVTKPAPTPTDTVVKAEPAPVISVPNISPDLASAPTKSPPPAPAPIAFNPDAPAMAVPSGVGGGVRFTPTRPGSPVATALVVEPVADVAPATTYVVKSGDSLWSIAKKHHLAVAELAAANSLAPNANLRPGQKLLIAAKSMPGSDAPAGPAGGGSSAKAAPAVSPGGAATRSSADAVKHIVKSGETLGIIARNYGVRQGDIAVANNISDPAKIRAGMEIVIPGWQAPAGKSGKGTGKAGAGSAPKPAEARPSFNVEPPPPAATAPPPAVPIIRLDDNLITPAPKP